MPQAERQLPLSELTHYQASAEVALQPTAPSLCFCDYISCMKSEVTHSLAGDISYKTSQLKQSTQDYANRSACLGGVSPLQHYLWVQKHCTYFYLQHLEHNAGRGVKFPLKDYRLGVVFNLLLGRKGTFFG